MKIDDVFPDPNENGVRIYAETENVIYGWVENDAAIGHGYAMKNPKETRFILPDSMQGKPDVCWCAYVQKSAEGLDDARQTEVRKIVEVMRKAAVEKVVQ